MQTALVAADNAVKASDLGNARVDLCAEMEFLQRQRYQETIVFPFMVTCFD